MNPAYDDPPPPDYRCPVCQKAGHHWKSLCYKNMDPNCIRMKRQKAGIVTEADFEEWATRQGDLDDSSVKKKRKGGGIIDDWARDIKPSTSCSF